MTRTMQALLAVGIIKLLARGTDLIFGDPYSSHSPLDLGGAEEFVWGLFCLAAALVVLVGVATRRAKIAVNGALLAFSTYAMFTWFVMDDTIMMYPPDDWRIFFDHLCSSLFWLVCAVSISFRHGVYEIRRRKEKDLGLGTAAD